MSTATPIHCNTFAANSSSVARARSIPPIRTLNTTKKMGKANARNFNKDRGITAASRENRKLAVFLRADGAVVNPG
jgi:hypothetical protein